MKVESFELLHVQIPMKRAFKHALSERTVADSILVRLADDVGNVGWGEIKPRPYVTGESLRSVLEVAGPELGSALQGESFDDADAVADWLREAATRGARNLATLCGFDLALIDLAGQTLGFEAASLLGGQTQPELPPGVIIGFEIPTDNLGRYCATLRLAGRKHIKVKVGLDDDRERLEIITDVFKDLPLRIDANAAWAGDEAIERLRELSVAAPIESVEQPVPAADLDSLRKIRQATGLKVMADESVCTIEDAQRLIAEDAVDIFNVRLGKNGGLIASLALCDRAREAEIGLHLGTMVAETGLLSRASEVFGRCVQGFACLDGKGQSSFLLEVDILREGSETRSPLGLGVQVDPERVESLTKRNA